MVEELLTTEPVKMGDSSSTETRLITAGAMYANFLTTFCLFYFLIEIVQNYHKNI